MSFDTANLINALPRDNLFYFILIIAMGKNNKKVKRMLDKKGMRESHDNVHNGFEDSFEPLESLDLSKVKSFYDLTKAMSKTAFQGRNLGEAVDVFEAMVKDPDCFVNSVGIDDFKFPLCEPKYPPGFYEKENKHYCFLLIIFCH